MKNDRISHVKAFLELFILTLLVVTKQPNSCTHIWLPVQQNKYLFIISNAPIIGLVIGIGHYLPLFLVSVSGISEICNCYCNKHTNNVISCDYNIIMILIIIEKCSFLLKDVVIKCEDELLWEYSNYYYYYYWKLA